MGFLDTPSSSAGGDLQVETLQLGDDLTLSDQGSQLGLQSAAGFGVNLDWGNNSDDRDYDLPNEDGVLATQNYVNGVFVAPIAGTTRFQAYKNSGSTNFGASTNNTQVYNAEFFDVGNNFASNQFTAPATGVYFFSTQLRFSAHATSIIEVWFDVSGTIKRYVTVPTTQDYLCLSAMFPLTSGQTVKVVHFSANTYQSISDDNGERYPIFEGFRIA